MCLQFIEKRRGKKKALRGNPSKSTPWLWFSFVCGPKATRRDCIVVFVEFKLTAMNPCGFCGCIFMRFHDIHN